LQWLPKYQGRFLTGDVVAAVTVWALLVPEALAYAVVAGVPVQFGPDAVYPTVREAVEAGKAGKPSSSHASAPTAAAPTRPNQKGSSDENSSPSR
jgi:MFS superfamily sulfate permease-like transporter